MSSEALGDVVHAVEEEVEHMKHDIEDERKKVEAMKDGPKKDAALKTLHEHEAALHVKEDEMHKLEEYQEHRHEDAVGKADDVLKDMEEANCI